MVSVLFQAKYATTITTIAKSNNRPYFPAPALEKCVNAHESQIIRTASLGFLTKRSDLACCCEALRILVEHVNDRLLE